MMIEEKGAKYHSNVGDHQELDSGNSVEETKLVLDVFDSRNDSKSEEGA